MDPKIFNWKIDPELFRIADTLPIRYYGLLFVTGILIAHYVLKRVYLKENIPLENLEKLFVYVIVGIILGARLGHCLFYEPSYYFNHPLEILLPIKKIGDGYRYIGFQGLASHGGTLGVIIAIILYCKRYKIAFLDALDKIALVAPLVACFIRLGDFMNSEIYGNPTNGNWGVIFEKVDLIPRHPTQLYEATSYLLIFAFCMGFYKRKVIKQSNGTLLGTALVLIFLARFIIEYFKENQVGFEEAMLFNMGQLLSIPFIVIGLFLSFGKLSTYKVF